MVEMMDGMKVAWRDDQLAYMRVGKRADGRVGKLDYVRAGKRVARKDNKMAEVMVAGWVDC